MIENIIFYISKGDWREEIKYIKASEFDENTMNLVEVDQEELKKISEVFSRPDERIEIYKKDDTSGIRHFIKRKEFNPLTMTIVYVNQVEYNKKQKELKQDWKEGKINVNIMAFTRNRRPGIGFKDKVDEGAMEDLLDRGFEDAKKRAAEREKKTGFGFKRNKKLSKKKIQRAIREGKLRPRSRKK